MNLKKYKILLIVLIIIFVLLIINTQIKSKIKNSNLKNSNKLKKIKENLQNVERPMLNIYNKPLQPCGDQSMTSGSWDSEGKCSELGGGVHQICIKEIANNTKNFSSSTGQSDWSDNRGTDNHCVCLGAWSLYNAKTGSTSNVLKCDAIPKASLSSQYVSKFSEGWNKWNGLELDNQIKDGVEALVHNCSKGNITDIEELHNNYCAFAKKVPVLKKSKMFNSICKNIKN